MVRLHAAHHHHHHHHHHERMDGWMDGLTTYPSATLTTLDALLIGLGEHLLQLLEAGWRVHLRELPRHAVLAARIDGLHDRQLRRRRVGPWS